MVFVLKIWLLLCVCRFKEREWDTRRMLTSGGMPSSHSATVISLATCIGLQEGVMYDATGVRLHAGRQAEV
ncbi:hypothetical protein HanLR1_Chr05g0192491 [Helianthus annuus]|nr:hypothetical protein HanLR1_Chr05g0192491 [Helianthus annuus]